MEKFSLYYSKCSYCEWLLILDRPEQTTAASATTGNNNREDAKQTTVPDGASATDTNTYCRFAVKYNLFYSIHQFSHCSY